MSAGSVVEEEPASRVGADAKWRGRTFRDDFRRGTRYSREQPLQAFFAGHEFEAPCCVVAKEFVMALSDAERFIDRLNAVTADLRAANDGVKRFLQSGVERLGSGEKRVRTLSVDLRQRK